jgi:hypothetical protein
MSILVKRYKKLENGGKLDKCIGIKSRMAMTGLENKF